jgi:hypothetical protein
MGNNGIINPSMEISQRGDYTSATAIVSDTYYLDMWKVIQTGVSGTVQQTTTTPNDYTKYSMKIAATAGSGGFMLTRQTITDYERYKGKTITASCEIASTYLTYLRIYDGVSYQQSFTINNNELWETVSITGTISTSATTLEIDVFFLTPSVSNYFNITNMQLCEGKKRLPFEFRFESVEELLCRKYCLVYGLGTAYSSLGLAHSFSTTDVAVMLPLATELYTTPTIVKSGTWWAVGTGGVIGTTTVTVGQQNSKVIELNIVTSTLTIDRTYRVIAGNDTAAYIVLDASP